MTAAVRHPLPPNGTVSQWVALIDQHALDSRGLGHAAYVLADLREDLEAGPDPEVPDVTLVLLHAASQLVLIEYREFALSCPSCGRREE